MSTENVSGPDNKVPGALENREIREQNVVRVFLYQSRSAESIPDNADIKTLEFTHMVLLRKGLDSINPNQVMPVGGVINPGEGLINAGMREAVEETHLRPTSQSLRSFQTEQTYEFTHPRKGIIRNRAHFLKGQLLPEPMDTPYQLDPAEDKIGSFVKLLPQDAERLFSRGVLELEDGTVIHLLDSLSPDPADREATHTSVNIHEVAAINREALYHLQMTDCKKKLAVVRNILLRNTFSIIPALAEKRTHLIEQTQFFMQELNELDVVDYQTTEPIIRDVDRLWQEVVEHCTVHDVRLGLENSNLSAKLHNSTEYYVDPSTHKRFDTLNLETGRGVPTINLVLPLLIPDSPSKSDLRTLAENPQSLKIMRLMQAISKFEKKSGIAAATVDTDHDKALVRALSEKKFLPNSMVEHYPLVSQQVDDFFESIRDEAQVDASIPIDQLDEVKRASLGQLIMLAQGEIIPDLVRPEINHRVLQWEARRKLALLLMFSDASQIWSYYEELGIEPIDRVESEFVELADGNNFTLRFDVAEPVKLGGESITESHRYTRVRQLHRRKKLHQIFRKMMVRDEGLGSNYNLAGLFKDIEAETYIFDGPELSTPDLLTDKEFMVPRLDTGELCVLRDASGRQIETFRAPQVIADLIVSLLQSGNGEIEIDEYKPLPKPGQPIISNSVGGGALVRFAKFYIKHTEPVMDVAESPIERYREVQLFVPNEIEGLSAQQEFERKKADDKNYAIKRAFHTKGLRSFMELLFPAEIYGDSIRAMYKDKVS